MELEVRNLLRLAKINIPAQCAGIFLTVKNPSGVRGPQPPEASIGFGDMCGKSAKALRSKGFFSWFPGRAAGTREPCKP
ncbi:MAG: hypothetical protein PUC76_07275, partial [Clostridia bacterium]|nr:hypothetical protein [Clostridia bacterium]